MIDCNDDIYGYNALQQHKCWKESALTSQISKPGLKQGVNFNLPCCKELFKSSFREAEKSWQIFK